MTSIPAPIKASEALRKQADRIRASARGKSNEAEKLRQAQAMQGIADHVAQGVDALRAALGPPGQATGGITIADRARAGEELYGLALRRAERGTQRQFDAAAKGGWERGGSGLPIHRATLREAASLYELALAVHYDSYWDYSRGILHESLGEFAEAVRILENLTGSYRTHGATQAERCRKKLSRNYDAQAELDKALGKQLEAAKGKGATTSLLRKAFTAISAAHRRASTQPYPVTPPDDEAVPLDSEALDRAEEAARDFAEHLANGDFIAAKALLARELTLMTVDELRDNYEQMMAMGEYANDDGGDGGEITIMVMSSSADMPNLEAADLGWVYVAISNHNCNEAITVVVTDEGGNARIRELEWGRP